MYTLFDFRMEIYRPNVVKAQSQRVQCERCNGCEHSNERHTCMYRCIHKCIRLFLFHIVFSLFQWICVYVAFFHCTLCFIAMVLCISNSDTIFRRSIWNRSAHIHNTANTFKTVDYSMIRCERIEKAARYNARLCRILFAYEPKPD